MNWIPQNCTFILELKVIFSLDILQAATAGGLLYVLTKYGLMFVCDMSTAQCLCQVYISKEVVFTSSLTAGGSGLIVVNRAGQVSASASLWLYINY